MTLGADTTKPIQRASLQANAGSATQATILFGSWLDARTLLCSTTWPGGRSRQPMRGAASSAFGAIPLRAYAQPLPAEGDRPSGTLLVLRFDDAVEADTDLRALVLESGRAAIVFAPEDLGSVVVDLQTHLRETLAARSSATRTAIIEVVVDSGGPDQADPNRAERMRDIRDALRERRRPSVIAADVPQALYVEAIHRIDDHDFYVRGWARDPSAETVRVTAVAPEGARVDLTSRLYRYPRPDLDDFYGSPKGGTKAGFLGYFQSPIASTLRDGWVFEMENSPGSAVEFAAGAVEGDLDIVRSTLLADLFHELPGKSELIRDHIHPAVSALQQRRNEGICLTRVEQFGRPPTDPDVSILVPLYGRIDFLEQQLAQFVHDPAMREVDLVYLLDSPELGDALLQAAAWLEPLYDVPFRIALSDRNGGFAAANNLAATIARGRLLLLLNSDILPEGPGWLAAMSRAYDTIPNVGIIAPKLLYEDGSLQHAGLYFHFERSTGTWNNEHYFKGMHGSLPAAREARQVPAVTAACAMISADLYADLGGLKGTYVQGDYEDSDLCLRLYERGLGAWYVPSATLYHLEGQSYPSELRQMTGRYNRWVHSELWHERIPQVMADLDAGAVRPAARKMPQSVTKSPARTTRRRVKADGDATVGR